MKQRGRIILLCVAACVVSLPVSLVSTLILFPLWSWVEATFGIESVGHSGPAEWCYWLTFAVVSAVAVTTLLLRHRSKRVAKESGR